MEYKLTKEIAEELMKMKGQARGVHFQNDADFVLKEKGKQGLEQVERTLFQLGYPIEYGKIKQFEYYPMGLRALSLLAIKQTFNWPDEKIEELGAYAMKVSLIIKIFMRYFFSLEKILQEAPKIWEKYFDVGKLVVEDFNLEKKYVILKIEDFSLHPIYCLCLRGVFTGLGKMIIKSKEITCQETKCFFEDKKNKEHHFVIQWK